MIKCGITLNLSNFQSDLKTRIGGLINLSGTLGTPAGLAGIKASLTNTINGIKSKLNDLIPEIPTLPQSLRNDLADLFTLPAGSTAALAKISKFVQDYTGLESISGFANLNLNDLAKSVYSFSGTFDPCSAANNIPNIIKNPTTGALEVKPMHQPELGSTVIAKALKEVETVANNFDSAKASNSILSASDTVATSLKNLQDNIQPAVDDAIRKMPDGSEVLETQEDLINRLADRSSVLSARQGFAA